MSETITVSEHQRAVKRLREVMRAEIALLQVENASLREQQVTHETAFRERAAHQRAANEVLQTIVASPGDATPVFELMVQHAATLCDADVVLLHELVSDTVHLRAIKGFVLGIVEEIKRSFPRQLSEDTGAPTFTSLRDGTAEYVPDSELEPRYRETMRWARVRSGVALPIMRDGRVVGSISVFWRLPNAWSESQIGLLHTFAEQAVIAIASAETHRSSQTRLTDLRKSLERETATAEILTVINANPGQLSPVCDAMLESAMRLCEAAFGVLFTQDGQHWPIVAKHGVPPAYAKFRESHPLRSIDDGPLAQVLRTKQSLHIQDFREEEIYQRGDESSRAIVDLGGARTLLLVPLIKLDVVLGAIAIYRQEVRSFTARQIRLLETFAAQAVIAIENVRLMTEQREALEEQAATAEILGAINANPGNAQPVYDLILEKAHALCGAAIGGLMSFDGTRHQILARRGIPEAVNRLVLDGTLPIGPASQAMLDGARFVHTPDISALPQTELSMIQRGMLDHSSARSTLAVPLRKDDAYMGHITAWHDGVHSFTEQEISLLEGFASQAVIAMENARLLNEIRERQGELDVTFESMGDGVALFDESRHLSAWNRNFQDMLEVASKVVEARPSFEEYVHYLAERGEFGPEPAETVERLLAQAGRSASFERTRPSGQTIQIRTNPTPTGGFVLMYTDVTERKRDEEALREARDAAQRALVELRGAQDRLVQSEKMASLGQLTAGIAHEIKNPLNFVNNFSKLSIELIEELKELSHEALGGLDAEQRGELEETLELLTGNLGKIAQHGERADKIVKSMLEHSRGLSGERRRTDLNALVDEALNLAYHGARAQDPGFNINLERDYAPGLEELEIAPQEMTRVFLNLFGNGFYAASKRAREAAGDGAFEPTLSVQTRKDGQAIEVRVRDNGMGIAPELRERLFEPFFTTKPTGEGTGLGLSISYDIVTQQHGGTLSVDSEPGAYCEFIVRLPRGQALDS